MGDMEEMENVLNNLAKAIDSNVKDLLKAKDLEQRKVLADITQSLCESMGVFFNALEMQGAGYYDDPEDEDLGF